MTPEISVPNTREIVRVTVTSNRSDWSERQDGSFSVGQAWTRKEIVTGVAPGCPIFVAESKWCPISAACSPFASLMPDTFNTYWITLGAGGKKIPCTENEFLAVVQRWNDYKQEIETDLRLLLADLAENPARFCWKKDNGNFVAETQTARIVLSCETKQRRFSRAAYSMKAISKENDSIDVSVSGRAVKALFTELSRVA